MQLITNEMYFYSAINLIQAAQKEILIINFKMESPIGKKKQKLVALYNALEKKAAAGISIKILLHGLSGQNTIARANITTALFLKKKSINCRTFKNWQMIHAKVLISDNNKMILGSHNWSTRALSYNLETSILILDPKIINQAQDFFFTAWENASNF